MSFVYKKLTSCDGVECSMGRLFFPGLGAPAAGAVERVERALASLASKRQMRVSKLDATPDGVVVDYVVAYRGKGLVDVAAAAAACAACSPDPPDTETSKAVLAALKGEH